MTYELKFRQIEIQELDAFLEEYRALCEKHGIQFVSGDYGYDGGSYMTIERYSDGTFYLNLDYADQKIPFMARAMKRLTR